jgi:hypothetical protein
MSVLEHNQKRNNEIFCQCFYFQLFLNVFSEISLFLSHEHRASISFSVNVNFNFLKQHIILLAIFIESIVRKKIYIYRYVN